VISDVLMRMPYVDGELPVYWWDSEADRCMVIGIFRHGTCLYIPYVCSLVSVVGVCLHDGQSVDWKDALVKIFNESRIWFTQTMLKEICFLYFDVILLSV